MDFITPKSQEASKPLAVPCEICGLGEAVFQCDKTGLRYGRCCKREMDFATRFLQMGVAHFGLCHPLTH